jgi:hypothetical protein
MFAFHYRLTNYVHAVLPSRVDRLLFLVKVGYVLPVLICVDTAMEKLDATIPIYFMREVSSSRQLMKASNSLCSSLVVEHD